MKISTETISIANKVGYEKAVEFVGKAGFDAWDFSMFSMISYDRNSRSASDGDSPLCSDGYAEYAMRLKRIGLDNGIVCNQSHAPFPSYAKGIEKYILRAIECTAIAGGNICVVHPDNNKSAEENAEFYFRLLPFAKEHGVKIATENMWNWNDEKGIACAAACSHHDDFLKHIKAVDDEYFVACLDIGHAEMAGLGTSAVQMVRTLKDHVKALHIHDNDKLHDSHALPFTMNIDYPPIIKALKEIGYDGYFTLEADCYLRDHTAENVFEGVIEMKNAARRLADEFEKV